MQELLRYLVTNDLAGNSDRLRSFNIAIDVFGRTARFDPNNDSIVRVEAARLRRMLAAHYAGGAETPIKISIPKGRYIPAYETTGAALALAHRSTNWPASGPGIAVLPFAGDAEDQTLCTALTYELNFQLSRFAEFRIVDASSLIALPASAMIAAVITTLECPYLLKGQLSATDSRLIVHAQAISTSSARVLWSERYDAELGATSLLDLYESIASGIAQALAPTPGVLVMHGLEQNPAPMEEVQEWQAVDCVTCWHYYRTHSRTPVLHHNLTQAMFGVLKHHQGFSLGWAIAAHLELDRYAYRMAFDGQQDVQQESTQRTARTYAERALGLSRINSIARYAIGLADYFNGDLGSFRDHFLNALQLNPNSLDLLHHGGTLLAFGGAWEEGKALILDTKTAYSNSLGLRFFNVVDALREGNTERACDLLAIVAPQGKWYWGNLLRCAATYHHGDKTSAREALLHAFGDNPNLEGNLQHEVDKWFGDEPIRALLLDAFTASER